MKAKSYIRTFGWLLLLPVSVGLSGEERAHRKINLRGTWRFEIGDNEAYADPDYDDHAWERIRIPGKWEDSGFPGYDGYAWYRKRVYFPDALKNTTLILKMGRIDDVDRVFVNGRLISGSGTFPPDYQSAWAKQRSYRIPAGYLEFGGENLIAVQVYDDHAGGGILDGEIGVYAIPYPYHVRLSLEGAWRFSTGDNLSWGADNFPSDAWDTITVPGKWEFQGYPKYNGYAWYRKQIRMPASLKKERLILALGKIDDIDELYINGVRIGRTGRFPNSNGKNASGRAYTNRFYAVPATLIRWNQVNVIAVRVYDLWGNGGIYEGPVGFITRDDYMKIRRKKQSGW